MTTKVQKKKSKLVLNDKPADQIMQRIVFNFGGSPIRYDVMDGVAYIVAPAAMMQEGVIDGSGGKIFYPHDEIEDSTSVWNMKPLVVYHPQDKDGNDTTACDPDVITNRGVGVILNTICNDKLRTEAWIDPIKAKKVDARILEALEKNQVMEVSTGLFMNREKKDGEHKGEKYTYVAHNLKPDHLAILPDKIGAYSVAKGGGLLQTNEGAGLKPWGKDSELIFNGMSHNKIRSAISKRLKDGSSAGGTSFTDSGAPAPTGGMAEAYIEDVYDDQFIYSDFSGKLYRQNYKVADGGVSFTGTSDEVKRVTEYRTAKGGAFVGNAIGVTPVIKEKVMTKAEKVAHLIANGWATTDKEFLDSLDDSKLDKLMKPVPAPTVVEKIVANITPVVTPISTPATFDTILKSADPATQEMIQNGIRMHQAEKARLIAIVTNSKANQFTPEALNALSVADLGKIAAFIDAGTPVPAIPLYFGQQGSPPVVNSATVEEPLVTKGMSFEALDVHKKYKA